MATLAVRTLQARDLTRIRSVRQRCDRLDGPACRFRSSSDFAHHLMAALPSQIHDERAYVATVDGELCAYLVVERQPRQFQWELVEIAAGSPRLNANDEVCAELWTAMIEYAVQQAGSSGAKRIFATAEPGTPAYDSLRSTAFGAYMSVLVMMGQLSTSVGDPKPDGMRRQLNSDVWSIHQLYHQNTPHTVQFAEALTSTEWEIDDRSWWRRIASTGIQRSCYVLDTSDGVVGYCRIERRHGRAMISFMVAPHCSESVPAFLLSAARDAGVGPNDIVQIEVPGYAMEHVAELEGSGFHVSWERTALVKHTTIPMVVRPHLSPISIVEERERAIRGIPSLYRGR